MKILNFILLTLAIFFVTTFDVYGQLAYSEGGPSVSDPGADLPSNLRRYLDATNGDDKNDGTSPTNA